MAVTVNGLGVLSNGMLLVSNNIKAKVCDLTLNNVGVIVNDKSKDDRVIGEIETHIDIIYTDWVKYKPCGDSTPKTKIEYKENKRI